MSSLQPSKVLFSVSGCINTDAGCIPREATLVEPDGTKYLFKPKSTQAGSYYAGNTAASTGRLVYNGSNIGWTLTRSDKVHEFNRDGFVKSVKGRGGAVLMTMTYTGSGLSTQLVKVTNAVGHAVSFTWAGGRVTSATDPNGNTWSYAYDGSGMLASVTSPGPSPDTRTYHYEVAGKPALLTGISINGVRYSTYAYGADGRVSSSALAGNEQRDVFAYGSNQTTVTNAAGQATTYTFASILGNRKLTGTSRAATASCIGSSASIAYDANGYPDAATDHNGVQTDYSYDASGKLAYEVNAVGTSVAIGRVNTWQGNVLAQTAFTNASGTTFKKVVYTYFGAGNSLGKLASETWSDVRTGAQRQRVYNYNYYANKTISSQTITESLPAGSNVTTLSYDTYGNIGSVSNGASHLVTFSNYNAMGRPGRSTDENGVLTDYLYDSKGNLLSSRLYLSNGERLTTYSYNNNRQVTDTADATGRVERRRYNAATRLSRVGNAANEFVDLLFDVSNYTASSQSTRRVPGESSSGNFVSTTKLTSQAQPGSSSATTANA